MDYLNTLSTFAASLRFAALPPAVRAHTGWILADTLAAIAAGSAEPELRALAQRQRLDSPATARVRFHVTPDWQQGRTTFGGLLSALVVWGVKPGPLMITESPEIFWGLIASMWIGNVLLLIMNLPLAGLFAKLLKVPVRA
jgi:2-methylcitrate dehydratase PrpD